MVAGRPTLPIQVGANGAISHEHRATAAGIPTWRARVLRGIESINMSRRLAPAALVALVGLMADAQAFNFGKARVLAVLGQPLEVTIPVQLAAGEEITPECLSADVYYGESRQAAANVRTRLDAGFGPDRTVRVYSSKVVDEPVVSVYLVANCHNVNSTRKWVAFADPPNVAVAETAPIAPETDAAASAPRAAVAAPVQPADGAVPARAARARAASPARPAAVSVVRRSAPVVAAAANPPQAKPAREDSPIRRPRGADLRTPPELTPRLRLDLIEMEALASPNLRLASDLPVVVPEDGGPRRAAAAALWKALNATPEELARDRDQMQALEKALAATRNDVNTTRQSLGTLQTRLEDAEASRYKNPLVFALGILSLGLAGAVGWLVTQRRRDQALHQAWWNAPGATQQPPAADTAAAGALAAASVARTDPPQAAAALAADDDADAAAGAPLTQPIDEALRPDAPESERGGAVVDIDLIDDDTGPRHTSVEELIDLEQQAEFFQVLGQDEAAIDLLMGHLRNPGGSSPMPYLKLMEIHQRRGDQKAYDEVRERFNGQFNAYAPAWEEELNQGRTLEDYPNVIGRLQTLWAMPARAMEVLQASLLRQDSDSATFDLPAYRELLFLYSVARDLAEEDRHNGSVDLLLPVGDDADGEAFTPSTLAPLVAGEPNRPAVDGDARNPAKAQSTGFIEFSTDLDLPSGPVGRR